MAIAATATASLRRKVIKTLRMKETVVISENVDKSNVIYSVLSFKCMETMFNNMIRRLKE